MVVRVALNIRNREAERLAAALAKLTGESKTAVVTKALSDRLNVVRRQRRRHVVERLDEIARHCASLPLLDSRTPEDMLYDERGLPR
jgi:antitoxin VapB